MEKHEVNNGIISGNDANDEYVNVHFFIGDQREIACFRPDQTTHAEIKDLFRSAAEAGPLDILKLRKGNKIFNISPHLPGNTPDDPYILQVVGAHPTSVQMIEVDLLRAFERRIGALEREVRDHQDAAAAAPCFALRELKKQVDAFKKKLETTEHLSWLGFYKQLPEPISSEACRKLQYRRKSDSIKRKVRERFLNICDVVVSSSVREWLRSPAFDARQWEDEELLLMLQTMFVELELPHKFNIPLSTLRNFIYEVYNNYNEVPFHNFRHCFCVAQMMYAMVWAVNLVAKIGDLEVLVLIVSCICHDLDHPGYNNIYQINARTELALRYNDISPLENHHCSVAFRVLEAPECNILASLDLATYRTIREGIIRCILATDMARHNEILAQFTDIVSDFNYTSKSHINLLSMVLIKVADISNEARPMDVAEPWLDSLLQEFFKQSDAEKLEGLPVTPFMDRDKVTKPSSQCSFIGLVLLPLFEILGELFPELQELIVAPVRYALDYYRRLNEAAKDERHQRKSIIELGEPSGSSGLGLLSDASSNISVIPGRTGCVVIKSNSSYSMRSRRSTGTLQSQSRSIEDETPYKLAFEEASDHESSDPETATEVEVSEKTLKFKISTESRVDANYTQGRKSYPGSRKGSREKSSLDHYNHDLAKAIQEREHENQRSRGDTLSSDISSPISTRSNDGSRIIREIERDEQQRVVIMLDETKTAEDNSNLILNITQQQRNNHFNNLTLSNEGACHETKSIISRHLIKDVVRCCCDDKPSPNNHKSLLSRLRNLTDRLSMSFDSKEIPITKSGKFPIVKVLNKDISITSSSSGIISGPSIQHNNVISICKKCNLSKVPKELQGSNLTTPEKLPSHVIEKRSMTLPKIRRSQDCKNKSWRMVFAKEKRSSVSLEALPPECESTNIKKFYSKHRRNFSNPEGKSQVENISSKNQSPSIKQQISFNEINVHLSKPKIFVNQINPGSSNAIENIGKVEIRRSSASMEDISKIMKQTEVGPLGCLLEQKKSEECQQHSGSLDSVLYKEVGSAHVSKKQVIIYAVSSSSTTQTKKPSASLFSRIKSGITIETGGTKYSNSDSLHDQQTTSWISSLTASFRPRKQA
ncbi:PREDICTED: uncharacterized protein LOC105360679 [Ceratosolen solmsi marchali]|uniref:Phosphodiesterase n=1 Tax=Ceratosolen solmsi marchali TaxID=326594 RepID=A0AAJ7DT58_9HYME|nr:PREDICTED: uncharacterized protein LOC105360679 [Ceratosolen solmsi marchali]